MGSAFVMIVTRFMLLWFVAFSCLFFFLKLPGEVLKLPKVSLNLDRGRKNNHFTFDRYILKYEFILSNH